MSVPDDLVLLALGRLAPPEREALTVRLKQDPALAREAEQIAAHLALYDGLPAPPEPAPFARLAGRLEPQPRRAFPWPAVVAAAAVVLVVLSQVVPTRWGSEWSGPLPRTVHAAAVLERRLEEGRVRVVLDAGAVLRDDAGPAVTLEAGRAWFEVGPGPFVVHTPDGDVSVLGTAFEVEVGDALRVEVAEGRVSAALRGVEAGAGIRAGKPYRLTSPPGRFARLVPLAVVGVVSEPARLVLRLLFENAAGFAREVPGPEAAATGLLLAFEGPDGARHSESVDVLAAAGGRIPPAGRVRLGPGERLEIPLEAPPPPGPAGSWRLTALYRPQGEAPISAAPVTFEISPR